MMGAKDSSKQGEAGTTPEREKKKKGEKEKKGEKQMDRPMDYRAASFTSPPSVAASRPGCSFVGGIGTSIK